MQRKLKIFLFCLISVSLLRFSPAQMTNGFALSPAIIAAVASHNNLSVSSPILSPISLSTSYNRSKCVLSISPQIRKSTIRCDLAVKSDADLSTLETEEDEKAKSRIGGRVGVTAQLKVYHVVKVPEIELMGMEGVIKDYVVIWKGKRISANLPYKVEFVKEIEGRGPVKFFTHLKDDEFEVLDP